MPLARFLGNAAFLGAEGGLLAIAAASLITTVAVASGAWIVILGILAFLQFRRTIEGVDLLVILGVTLAAVVFFGLNGPLQEGLAPIIVITLMSACGAVIVAIVFRLIFSIVSRIM